MTPLLGNNPFGFLQTQSPLTPIDLKSFKHSFPAHRNFNNCCSSLKSPNTEADRYSAFSGNVHTGLLKSISYINNKVSRWKGMFSKFD